MLVLRKLYKRSFGYEKRRVLARDFSVLRNILTKKVIYFRMPKVASESIVKSFNGDYSFIPHSYPPFYVKSLLLLRAKGFRFTFVRHPIMRFVSAYKWACRGEIDPLLYPLDILQRSAILAAGNPSQFCLKLEAMIKKRNTRMIHFYPQWTWVSISGSLMLDFIGKLETLEDDVMRLSDENSVYLDLNFGPNSKNSSSSISEDWERSIDSLGLTKKAVAALNSVYECDFRGFDYR